MNTILRILSKFTRNSSKGYVLILLCFLTPVLLLGGRWVLEYANRGKIFKDMKVEKRCAREIAMAVATSMNPGLKFTDQKETLIRIADKIYNEYPAYGDTGNPDAVPGLQNPIYSKKKPGENYDPTIIDINRYQSFSPKVKQVPYEKVDKYVYRGAYGGDISVGEVFRRVYFLKKDSRVTDECAVVDFLPYINSDGENVNVYSFCSFHMGKDVSANKEMPYLMGSTASNLQDEEYMERVNPNDPTVQIAIDSDRILAKTDNNIAYAVPAECNVDIVITVPTNMAACNKNNRDANTNPTGLPDVILNDNTKNTISSGSLARKQNVKNFRATPIYQIAQAYHCFLQQFFHTRGTNVGLIPYSGKLSLPPDRAEEWSQPFSAFSWPENSQNIYSGHLAGNAFYGSKGEKGVSICAAYDSWGGFNLPEKHGGYGIMMRGNTQQHAEYANNYVCHGDLLDNSNPANYKFYRFNYNPCYITNADLFNMINVDSSPKYCHNPYFLVELQADVAKVDDLMNVFVPFNDQNNNSNFIFLPITWAHNLFSTWTKDPKQSSLTSSEELYRQSKSSANRKKVVVLIVNKPDWFEPNELTYLGFDNDMSEIPFAESDCIRFDIRQTSSQKYEDGTSKEVVDVPTSMNRLYGQKKVLSYYTAENSEHFRWNSSSGYYQYVASVDNVSTSNKGSSNNGYTVNKNNNYDIGKNAPVTGKLCFSQKYLVRITVEPCLDDSAGNIEFKDITVGDKATTTKELYDEIIGRRDFFIEPQQISSDPNEGYCITFRMKNIRLISAEITNRPYKKIVPKCDLTGVTSGKGTAIITTNLRKPLNIFVETGSYVEIFSDNGVRENIGKHKMQDYGLTFIFSGSDNFVSKRGCKKKCCSSSSSSNRYSLSSNNDTNCSCDDEYSNSYYYDSPDSDYTVCHCNSESTSNRNNYSTKRYRSVYYGPNIVPTRDFVCRQYNFESIADNSGNLNTFSTSGGVNFGHNLSTKKLRYAITNARISSARLKNQLLRWYSAFNHKKDNINSKEMILNDVGHATSVNDPEMERYSDPCISTSTCGTYSDSKQVDGFYFNHSDSGSRREVTNAYNVEVTYRSDSDDKSGCGSHVLGTCKGCTKYTCAASTSCPAGYHAFIPYRIIATRDNFDVTNSSGSFWYNVKPKRCEMKFITCTCNCYLAGRNLSNGCYKDVYSITGQVKAYDFHPTCYGIQKGKFIMTTAELPSSDRMSGDMNLTVYAKDGWQNLGRSLKDFIGSPNRYRVMDFSKFNHNSTDCVTIFTGRLQCKSSDKYSYIHYFLKDAISVNREFSGGGCDSRKVGSCKSCKEYKCTVKVKCPSGYNPVIPDTTFTRKSDWKTSGGATARYITQKQGKFSYKVWEKYPFADFGMLCVNGCILEYVGKQNLRDGCEKGSEKRTCRRSYSPDRTQLLYDDCPSNTALEYVGEEFANYRYDLNNFFFLNSEDKYLIMNKKINSFSDPDLLKNKGIFSSGTTEGTGEGWLCFCGDGRLEVAFEMIAPYLTHYDAEGNSIREKYSRDKIEIISPETHEYVKRADGMYEIKLEVEGVQLSDLMFFQDPGEYVCVPEAMKAPKNSRSVLYNRSKITKTNLVTYDNKVEYDKRRDSYYCSPGSYHFDLENSRGDFFHITDDYECDDVYALLPGKDSISSEDTGDIVKKYIGSGLYRYFRPYSTRNIPNNNFQWSIDMPRSSTEEKPVNPTQPANSNTITSSTSNGTKKKKWFFITDEERELMELETEESNSNNKADEEANEQARESVGDTKLPLLMMGTTIPINTVLYYGASGATDHAYEWQSARNGTWNETSCGDATIALKRLTADAMQKLKSTYGSNLRIYVVLYRKQPGDYSYLFNNAFNVLEVDNEDDLKEVLEAIATEIKTWAGYKEAEFVN